MIGKKLDDLHKVLDGVIEFHGFYNGKDDFIIDQVSVVQMPQAPITEADQQQTIKAPPLKR